ncbi:RDD family protein [Asticcacaulis biprosthecium C19]|uniref:RDD family protein n=1 Tax=Asticcacaulis biprosthecium C19 TaxID=715226 RepID=F4QLQ2_9CAUL|nr:RDD family protein [Asticcacaulis biprosthecium]EGF93550.1 RDD family protein [Asticcacaulis biprosthecium C19]
MAKPAKRDLMSDAPYGEYGRTATLISTPEGVILPFINASFGERLGALLIDFLIMAAIPIVLLIVWVILPMEHFKEDHKAASSIMQVLGLAAWFFVRSGYFIFFEMGPKAATPGKRALKLRVVAHDGGRLTPAAVFTRNALREVELYIPLGLILGGASGTGNPMLSLMAFLWALALVLLPLFNKQHARLGDFLAGTRVIHMPKASLSYDLADLEGDARIGLTFTPEQLAYGEMELQVLEQVLRERKPAVMRAVADKIKARISWQAPKNSADMPSDETFLRAYYGALRAWLEGKMLMGKRRKDKHEAALT